MELKLLFTLRILAVFIQRALSLVGSGVCNKTGGEECCYSYFRIQEFCVPCPHGTFRNNCTERCSTNGAFGMWCESMCNCTQYEVCHPSDGCIPMKGHEQMYHESARNETQSGTHPPVSGTGTPPDHTNGKSNGHGMFAYFSISELAVLGAFLFLIILVIVNIIVCSRLVMKVKRVSNLYFTPICVAISGINRTFDLILWCRTHTYNRRMDTCEPADLDRFVCFKENLSDLDERETRDDHD